MVLHFEEMDKFGHAATLFNDLFQVEVRVGDEFVNCFLVGENAILVRLTVLENTEVWLSRHEQTLLNNVDEAKSEEIERNMHEVRR